MYLYPQVIEVVHYIHNYRLMINTKTIGRQKQDDYKEAVERKNSNRDFQTAVSI